MLEKNYLLVYSYDFDEDSSYFNYCTIYEDKKNKCYLIVPDEISSEFIKEIESDKNNYRLVNRGFLDSN